MAKEYIFTVKLPGFGETPEQAWRDIQESMGGDLAHMNMPDVQSADSLEE